MEDLVASEVKKVKKNVSHLFRTSTLHLMLVDSEADSVCFLVFLACRFSMCGVYCVVSQPLRELLNPSVTLLTAKLHS